MRVEVPYDFSFASKALPAGTYTFVLSERLLRVQPASGAELRAPIITRIGGRSDLLRDGALVFDKAGRVFLQKRSQAKDSCPGRWDSSCSGHLDAGEDYDVAATRELREEIGLAPAAPPVRWLRLEASERTGWEFVWIYRLRSEGPFTLNSAEIESGAWFAPDEVDAGLRDRPEEFAGAFRFLWPLLRAKV